MAGIVTHFSCLHPDYPTFSPIFPHFPPFSPIFPHFSSDMSQYTPPQPPKAKEKFFFHFPPFFLLGAIFQRHYPLTSGSG